MPQAGVLHCLLVEAGRGVGDDVGVIGGVAEALVVGIAGMAAGLLKQAGFEEVALRLDLDFDGMRIALRDFGQTTRGADVAVVYFAGHGLELGGENFLVPVDAMLKSGSASPSRPRR